MSENVCNNQSDFNKAYNDSLAQSSNICRDQNSFNQAVSKILENMPKTDNICKDQDSFNHAYAKAVDNYNEIEYNKLSNNQKIVFSILLVLQCIFIIWGIILAIKYIPGPQRPIHVVFAITTGPIYVLSFYLSLLGGKLKD